MSVWKYIDGELLINNSKDLVKRVNARDLLYNIVPVANNTMSYT